MICGIVGPPCFKGVGQPAAGQARGEIAGCGGAQEGVEVGACVDGNAHGRSPELRKPGVWAGLFEGVDGKG